MSLEKLNLIALRNTHPFISVVDQGFVHVMYLVNKFKIEFKIKKQTFHLKMNCSKNKEKQSPFNMEYTYISFY
jgi:hypothetical protein